MRGLYIVAEVLTLWIILLVLGGWMIWECYGFSGLGQLFLAVYFVFSLGASIKLVLVGDRRSSWTGVYQPTRILALVIPGIAAYRRESFLPGIGYRKSFSFSFRTSRDVTSYDVIDALSAKLSSQGIDHNKAGGLLVTDNGTTWWVEPELGECRLTGWVESEDRQSQEQIIDGIREYLVRDLRLQLA